ncbi:MAG: hypothetical protein ACYDAD_01315 [Acidimicrobiales bacterium]
MTTGEHMDGPSTEQVCGEMIIVAQSSGNAGGTERLGAVGLGPSGREGTA